MKQEQPGSSGPPRRRPGSLRLRMTLWFTGSLLVVVGVLAVVTYWHLKHELQEETAEREGHKKEEWVLHGRYDDSEIQDILGELIGWAASIGIPLVLVALGLGYLVAARSARPARSLNRQLSAIGLDNLDQRVDAGASDREHVELAIHVNALLARIERSFDDFREHLTRVAHELRTPLHILRLRLEQAAPSLDPDFAESLDQELARLGALVDGLLTAARAEHRQLPVSPVRQSIEALLDDFLETYSLLAREAGRSLVLKELAPSGMVVFADPDHLKQILHNLLDNALKHGSGAIRLRVAARPSGRVTLLVANPVRTELEHSVPGTGLGLRLVRALARLQPDGAFSSHAGSKWFAARIVLRGGDPAGNSARGGS